MDSFLDPEQWQTQACQTVNNGVLEYACTVGYFSRKKLFQEGEGVLIDFKHVSQTDDYWWGMHFSSGSYGEDDWRTFGNSANKEYGQDISITKGTTWLGKDTRWTKSDVWYRLALTVGENGRIAILVWERDNPDAEIWKYITTMGEDWSSLEWYFSVNNSHYVVLTFDNYYEFAFSRIK